MATLLMTVLMLVGVLLIFIILLQRGRGGGLAGALGGMGGQSAFGTRAGDVFTKITIVLAVVWVVLAGVSGFALRAANHRYENPNDSITAPAVESAEPADGTVKPGEKRSKTPTLPAEEGERPGEESKSSKEGTEAAPQKSDSTAEPKSESKPENKSEPKDEGEKPDQPKTDQPKE
jgi:preprotein translocase subunit SecG